MRTSDARKRAAEGPSADAGVWVRVADILALAEDFGSIASGVEKTLVAGVRFGKLRDVQRQLRALVERSAAGEGEAMHVWSESGRSTFCRTQGVQTYIDDGECSGCGARVAPVPVSDEAEELAEHEKNLRDLWRELAEKRIEQGVDWPRIVLTLFDDIDRLRAARQAGKDDER